jgi:Polyketide cyclase / dehydrase and lipid transport
VTAGGVAVTVSGVARADPATAFAVIAPVDLTRIFTGMGPLPAVVGTRDQPGAWDHVGATRTVKLSDGSEAREAITAYAAPAHFAYRLDGFTGLLRLVVDGADGAWWFSPSAGGGTDVRWTYVFAPRPRRRWLVRVALAPVWRLYARRVLARAIAEAERAP